MRKAVEREREEGDFRLPQLLYLSFCDTLSCADDFIVVHLSLWLIAVVHDRMR